MKPKKGIGFFRGEVIGAGFWYKECVGEEFDFRWIDHYDHTMPRLADTEYNHQKIDSLARAGNHIAKVVAKERLKLRPLAPIDYGIMAHHVRVISTDIYRSNEDALGLLRGDSSE